MKITVTRPFLLRGTRQEVGTALDLADRALVAMLIQTGKAEAAEPVEGPSGPMTTETAAAAVRGKQAASKQQKATDVIPAQ